MTEAETPPDLQGGNRLLSNTAVNGLASVIVALLAVLMTPFLLSRLGPEEYGVWALATMLTFGNGLGGVADLGLQQAAVRFVATARGLGDADRIGRVVSTLLASFACIGVVVATALVLCSAFLVDVFGVAPPLESAARVVFALVAVQIALEVPAAAFLAVLEGAEAYPALRAIDTGSRVVFAGIAVLLILSGGGVIAMTTASVAISTVAAIMGVVLARRVEPRACVSLRNASVGTFRELARYGGQFLLLRVAGLIYRHMDRAILAVVLAAAALAEYDVVYRIHAVAAIALAVAPSAVMPTAAFLGARSDTERLRTLYLRGSRYAAAMCVPIAIGAIAFAPTLIRTWVGSEYEHLAGATRLFLAYPIFVSVHVIGVSMFYGLGHMRPLVRLVVPTTLANVVISVFLTHQIGLNGVIWGTLAGYLVVWVPYLRMFLREFDVSAAQWFREVVVSNVPGAAAQVGFALLVAPLVRPSSFIAVPLAAVAVSVAVNLAVFWFLVNDTAERASFVARFRSSSSATRQTR